MLSFLPSPADGSEQIGIRDLLPAGKISRSNLGIDLDP
jgi:hypothetical protein